MYVYVLSGGLVGAGPPPPLATLLLRECLQYTLYTIIEPALRVHNVCYKSAS